MRGHQVRVLAQRFDCRSMLFFHLVCNIGGLNVNFFPIRCNFLGASGIGNVDNTFILEFPPFFAANCFSTRLGAMFDCGL